MQENKKQNRDVIYDLWHGMEEVHNHRNILSSAMNKFKNSNKKNYSAIGQRELNFF